MKYLMSMFCMVAFLKASTQSLPPVGPSSKGDLDDREFVEYVNTNFYSIYSADFRKSLALTRQAVELCRSNRWLPEEALSQKNYGIILYLTGNYEAALKAYLRSYHLYDSLQEKQGLARVANEMGNYYQKQGEYEKALGMWAQSEQIAESIGDLESLGTSLGMQASFYWVRGIYEKSDPLYIRCYEIREDQKDSVGLGYILLDLADIERRKGNIEEALSHFERSTMIRKAIDDQQGVLENYHALGNLYYNLGQEKKSEFYYEKTAQESIQFGYPDLARKAFDSLASIQYYKGEYEKAFDYKSIAENLEDSLFNINRARVISELETKYETEKKEQQILLQSALISEKNAEARINLILLISSLISLVLLCILGILWRRRIKKNQQMKLKEQALLARQLEINATIKSQENERKRYARDLHDGFGQMISVLNLSLKKINDDSSSKQKAQLDNSFNVVNDMYAELKNICYDLMPQSLVENGLKDAVEEFTQRLNKTGSHIIEFNSFNIEARLPEVLEISIFRIIQEWINNILKYNDAQKIEIQITRDENEVTLLIEDDGIGFEKSKLTEGRGNGWRNLTTRANLIKGQLDIETSPNSKGTSLILNAPITTSLN